MHAHELIELASIVAAQGPTMLRTPGRLSTAGLEDYWTASKCRLDRWGRCLRQFSERAEGNDPVAYRVRWPWMRSVLEEILTGEVLTRVWSAVLCVYDRQAGTAEAEPIARSVLIGHLEARHRVLTLLVRGPGIDAAAAVRLNQLRRRCERWTDMLVGYLLGAGEVKEFAIDPARAAEFAEDLSYQRQMPGGHLAWPLVQASLRAAFRQGLAPVSPNADLNERIGTAILASFPPELFDSTGLLRSLWMTRLSNVATDAQGMLDDLLAMDTTRSPDHQGPPLEADEDRIRRFIR